MINLHKNGTVTIQDILLRVPTLPEYCEIIDRSAELAQQAQPMLERQRALREVLEKTPEDDTARQELRKLNTESVMLFSKVITGIVTILADDQKAAAKFAENPPAWTQDFGAYLALREHWNTAPFVGVETPPS